MSEDGVEYGEALTHLSFLETWYSVIKVLVLKRFYKTNFSFTVY